MKKTIYFALTSLVLGALSATAAVDCVKLSVAVKHAVAADRSAVLEIVTNQINANPGCACEVVKAAIEGSSADASAVAAIVEAAAVAAPDQMRLVAQCAIAVAPDSLTKVQSVIAKLDPNKGEGGVSAKSAKSGKEPAVEAAGEEFNPLDFPSQGLGQGGVGPRPGDNPNGVVTLIGGGDPVPVRNVNNPDPDVLDNVTETDPVGSGGSEGPGDDEGEGSDVPAGPF